MKPSIVELPGLGNYALIFPKRIEFGLGVTSKIELAEWIEEVEETRKKDYFEVKTASESVIGLIPTFGCNLNCVYCYANGGDTKEIILFSLATEAIKYVYESEGKDTLRLDLVGGGEPLLYIDLVANIVEYAKSLFKNVVVTVVTNATFGKRTLDWMAASKTVVRASYDGVMQDFQRPFRNGKSSKKTVMDNIRNMVAIGVPLTVSCVVTAEGVDTMRGTLDEMVDMGVKAIEFEAARGTEASRKRGWTEPDPIRFADALMNAIEYASGLNHKIQIFTGYFSTPRETTGYCGVSGKNRTVTPSGLVTSCLEVSRPTDPYAEKMLYGEVGDGKILINSEKLAFLENFDSLAGREGCLKCNLRMICQGGCPLAGVWERGFPLRKSLYTCTLERYFLPKLLLAMAENPDIASVVTNEAKNIC